MSRISSDVQNRPDPQHLVCRLRALSRMKRGSSRLTSRSTRASAPVLTPTAADPHQLLRSAATQRQSNYYCQRRGNGEIITPSETTESALVGGSITPNMGGSIRAVSDTSSSFVTPLLKSGGIIVENRRMTLTVFYQQISRRLRDQFGIVVQDVRRVVAFATQSSVDLSLWPDHFGSPSAISITRMA